MLLLFPLLVVLLAGVAVAEAVVEVEAEDGDPKEELKKEEKLNWLVLAMGEDGMLSVVVISSLKVFPWLSVVGKVLSSKPRWRTEGSMIPLMVCISSLFLYVEL